MQRILFNILGGSKLSSLKVRLGITSEILLDDNIWTLRFKLDLCKKLHIGLFLEHTVCERLATQKWITESLCRTAWV